MNDESKDKKMAKVKPATDPPTAATISSRGMMACQPQFALAGAQSSSPMFSRPKTNPTGRVAVVEILGVLTKPYMVEIRLRIIALASDDSVREIVLLIDSPGGHVAGANDLALAIRQARTVKPVHAFCEDLCASGAYWIASQATEVVVNPTGEIGSIGVFNLIADVSELEKNLGIKTYVVSTGALKTTGLGEVTDEQIDAVQQTVNELGRQFMMAIRRGREKRITAQNLENAMDGRIYVGQEAIRFGLADAVGTFEKFMQKITDRNPAEQFADLSGEEALDKYRSLLCERGKVDFWDEASKHHRDKIKKEFPALAKQAIAEQERQLERANWR